MTLTTDPRGELMSDEAGPVIEESPSQGPVPDYAEPLPRSHEARSADATPARRARGHLDPRHRRHAAAGALRLRPAARAAGPALAPLLLPNRHPPRGGRGRHALRRGGPHHRALARRRGRDHGDRQAPLLAGDGRGRRPRADAQGPGARARHGRARPAGQRRGGRPAGGLRRPVPLARQPPHRRRDRRHHHPGPDPLQGVPGASGAAQGDRRRRRRPPRRHPAVPLRWSPAG